MSDPAIIMRPALPEDAQAIWEIRNHPSVLEQSGSTPLDDLESHKQWFERMYFGDGNNVCFVLDDGGKVIGYCRFDTRDDNNLAVSIGLDPDYHGRGLGHALLAGALAKYSGNFPIVAEMQKDNLPSLKLFEKNGFERFKEDEDKYYYKYAKS